MEVSILAGSTVDITIVLSRYILTSPHPAAVSTSYETLPLHAGVATGDCVCRGVSGGKSVLAGPDTYAYFSTQISPPPDLALVDSSNTWAHELSCRCDNSLSARKSLVSIAGTRERYSTLLRGVGKKTDVRSSVDGLCFSFG